MFGASESCNVVNCNSYGSVSINKPGNGENLIGGISGFNYYGNIFKSYSNGVTSSVSATSLAIGCIAGYNTGSITACVSEGKVVGASGNSICIGGTVGNNAGGNTVDCISNAEIIVNSANSSAGGIAGYNGAVLKTSCFTGTVTATVGGGNIGGIVGGNGTSGSVMNCVTLGSVIAISGNVHPGVGSSSGILSGNVYDGASVFTLGGNPATPSARVGVAAATREQLTTESFYHEVLYWETKNWVIENGKLPYLSWYGEIATEPEEPEGGEQV